MAKSYGVKLPGFEFQSQHLLKFNHGKIVLLNVFPSLKLGIIIILSCIYVCVRNQSGIKWKRHIVTLNAYC